MKFKGVSYFPHHGLIMYSCNENNDDRPVQGNLDNEGPRDWQTLFAIMKFCYIEVLFHCILLLLGQRKSSVKPRTSL